MDAIIDLVVYPAIYIGIVLGFVTFVFFVCTLAAGALWKMFAHQFPGDSFDRLAIIMLIVAASQAIIIAGIGMVIFGQYLMRI